MYNARLPKRANRGQPMTNSSQTPFAARCAKLAARLPELQLDALLITSLPHISYLTGFTGPTAMAMIHASGSHFITDGRYTVQVAQEVDPSFQTVDNTNRKLLEDVLPGIGASGGWKRIGFEAGHTPHLSSAKYGAQDKWAFVPTENWV